MGRSVTPSERQKLANELANVRPDTCDGACDPEVYKDGKTAIIVANSRSSVIEAWVKLVRKHSKQKIDWNMVGGRAVISYIGDYQKVAGSIHDLLPALAFACWVQEGCELYLHWCEHD